MTSEEFIEKLNNIETQDKRAILFVVNGLVSFHDQFEINIEKKLLPLEAKNPQIFQIFSLLNEKYFSIKKTKEEQSKFLFRKSFKYIKKKLQEEKRGMLKRNIKRLYLEMYFKKNSSIKTITQNSLQVLFANKKYFKEFESFLQNYEEFVMKENQKKILKIAKEIYVLYVENRLDNIKTIQHFPWLKCWILSCKTMGEQILENMREQKKKKTNE